MDEPDPLTTRRHPVHWPSVERFNEATVIILTVCSKDRKRLFARPAVMDALLGAWERSANGWLVGRFVLMPDHLHLFCAPVTMHEEISLERWVAYWKSLVSRPWPWPQEQPIWQRHFWDTQMRPGEHASERWEYVRQNPVRAGLVKCPDDWPFQGELNVL